MRLLEAWEAQLEKPPTIWEVVQHGDARIAAAYITRNFRIAAKEAVLSHERVTDLRQLTIVGCRGDVAKAESYLRAPMLLFGRTPLEAAVESNNGLDEALRGLTIPLREHAFALIERISESWKLDPSERARLFGAREQSLDQWRADWLMIPLEAVTRALSLLFTDKALMRLFQAREVASDWLRGPQTQAPFNGDCPLALMTAEGRNGIRLVRDYLDRERLASDAGMGDGASKK